MKKIDVIISIIISGLTALYFIFLFKDINCNVWFLIIIFPILGAGGIWIAYLIGRRFLIVFQLAKFSLIGTAAALVDLGILNILMFAFGITAGIWFSLFKIISFVIAFFSKYMGNKLWAFNKNGTMGAGKELSKFFAVTLISLLVNVMIASLIVSFNPLFGLSDKIWANMAAIIAALTTALWNFSAYKYLVFKK